jgi:hypothetical protein
LQKHETQTFYHLCREFESRGSVFACLVPKSRQESIYKEKR